MVQKGKNSFKHFDFMALDFILAQIALPLAYYFRQKDFTLYGKDAYQTFILLIAVAALVNFFFTENYKNILKRGFMKELTATLKYLLLNLLLVIFWMFFSKQGDMISRSVVIYFILLVGVSSYAMRNLWKIHVRTKIYKNKDKQEHLLVFTHSSIAEEVIEDFLMHLLEPVKVVGLVTVDDGIPTGKVIDGVEVISLYKDATEYIRLNWVDSVYTKLPPDVRTPQELLDRCATMGVTTYRCLSMESERSVVQSIDRIAGNIVMVESMNIVPPGRLFAKRLLDIAGGFVGVLFTLLLTIIVGPVIYFTDPGPIFFSQNRVGKNGRIFKIYKFRSMYQDAEKRK
ncbi:MAG: sugar transferase, partial [Lachnospiraceae bacterium]|nr:sugar transferase [Lachnospiraceae bacterium]